MKHYALAGVLNPKALMEFSGTAASVGSSYLSKSKKLIDRP